MLTSLGVRDVVLIERAELSFLPGLNVLTGETGAGKSILLDALGLATGARIGGRASIRSGADQAVAVAAFELPPLHPAGAMIREIGLTASDNDVILRRVLVPDGRSRAFVNDQSVSIQFARDLGTVLVEVHGQSDDRGLFDSATHRGLLDSFGGHQNLVAEVAERFVAVTAARDRYDSLRASQSAAEREIEYLKFATEELRKLAPEPGEEAQLASDRALMMQAGRLAQEIAVAFEFVGGDGGAEVKLGNSLRRLSRLEEEGRAAARSAEEALDAALVLVQTARSELGRLLNRLHDEPGKLEQIEERLFALRAAARKYNVPVDGLAALASQFEGTLDRLEGGASEIAGAETELRRNTENYRAAATKLSSARQDAAHRLAGLVEKELAPLKLGNAKFRVTLNPVQPDSAGATGLERVSFEIATVEGAEFGSLARIASGGELARFALALKVALAESNPPAVLIFDEVDRGVGGAVAAAVGERLQRLAQNTQVLLVTHSPQVAARAVRHFRIVRDGDATRVDQLSPDDRVEEIARMLSGAKVTNEARAAARRLISEATAQPHRKKRAPA